MSEKPEQENSGNLVEQTTEEVLKKIEEAIGSQVELSVMDPKSGEIEKGTVIIEGIEGDCAYVSTSEEDPVFPIELHRIRNVQ